MMAQRKGAADEKRKTEKQEKLKATSSASVSSNPAFMQKFARENPPKEMETAPGEIAKREERMANPNLFAKNPAVFNQLTGEMEGISLPFPSPIAQRCGKVYIFL